MPTSKNDSKLLGGSFDAATRKLRKSVLYACLEALDMVECFRCGKPFTEDNFSIDHVDPWRSADDPVKLFFDLNNIAFSHLGCNSKASTGPGIAGSVKQAITHCPRGHEYSEENTYYNRGQRHCRECGRTATREWKQSNKGY